MPAPRIRLFLCAVLLALGVAACGGDEGLDRSDGQAVYRAAMRAVHDADWDALEGLLTKEARFKLEKDLRRLQANLAKPEKDSELLRRVREALGEGADAAIRTAVDGELPDVLRFFVQTWPREREPSPRGLEIGPQKMQVLYEAPGGVLRPVKLVLRGGRWYVQELHL